MTRQERDFRALARKHGYELTRTRGGHWSFRSPAGAVVIASGTPRSASAYLRQLDRQLRNSGPTTCIRRSGEYYE